MNNSILNEDDVFSGNLILVNPDFPIHETPNDLVYIHNTKIMLRREAALQLDLLMKEIDGWTSITPVSGFRSLSEQQEIWNDCLKESGIEFTGQFVAIPGHSEHQSGLAIDLGKTQEYIDFIRPEFPDDGICGKFKSAAAKYGFILRYPKGKEHITKISHEPWHFRYVGVPHAEIMLKYGFVLEEYIEFLTQFKFPNDPLIYKNAEKTFEISYLANGNNLPNLNENYCISENNCGGFIITKWGK